MSLPELLDETITEPAPPFPDLDGLITRERRRQRVRGAVVACATAAVVVAVALGAQSFARTVDGPVAGPGQPSETATATATPETPAQRYARLSEALRQRLSTVAPGSTVAVGGAAQAHLFTYLDTGFADYDGAIANVVVTTPVGEVDLTVQVLRPRQPGPVPTVGVLGRLFGGCTTFASDGNTPREPDQYDCTQTSGEGGSTISFGWMYSGDLRILQANAVFLNGTLVVAATTGEPGDSPLPPKALASLVAYSPFAT